MLFHHRLTTFSKFKTLCSDNRFHKTSNVEDFCCHVETKDGINCKLSSVIKGLHALDVDKDRNGRIFSSKIIDNGTKFSKEIFHAGLDDICDRVDT